MHTLLICLAMLGAEPESGQEGPISIDLAAGLAHVGDYAGAEKAFREIAKVGTTGSTAWLGLSKALARQGNYDEALAVLDAEDANPNVQLQIAQLDWTLGRYDPAVDRLTRMLEKTPGHAVGRNLLGTWLELLGRREDAVRTYRWFEEKLTRGQDLPADAEWLTHAGVGFYRYSVLTQSNLAERTSHVLHEMLQQAYGRLDREYWPARVAAADLLRLKFNNSKHDGSISDYLAALETNEHAVEALVGVGRVYLQNWDFEHVEEYVDKALAVNPKYVPAINLLARKFIIERRYEQAADTCERSLAINPNDFEAIAIKAASAACRFDDATVQSLQRRVEAINPRSAMFFKILGDALGGIRQYPESESAYLKSLSFEPTDANVRAELGLMYMQWGKEERARDALEAAWAFDQFNERTHNTLTLLESLANFTVHETDHFLVKYDEDKDPGLGEAFGTYLEDIYDDLIDDYEYPLDQKTMIELFPTQKAFAVRITGKPWIHTVGACTGRVIALASPRQSAELSGTYNFARVLKHEFTHTVTLAATKNRIPHWFTEGLAVLQEDAPRSFEWCRVLADAARRNELFTLESIDWGFIRPTKPHHRQMAYAQSEWMCEYIVERFGYERINEMLQLYRDGRNQEEVFTNLLKISLESFTQDFRLWARNQVKTWGFPLAPPEDAETLATKVEVQPENVGLRARLAKARLDEGEIGQALEQAEITLNVDENNGTALQVALEALAMAARHEGGDAARRVKDDMLPLAERLFQRDPKNWVGARSLAEIRLAREQFDKARTPLEALQKYCPMDPSSWRGLAGIYLNQGDTTAAMPQLLELARLDENDLEVRTTLGAIYRKAGELDQARYWYREALYIAPLDQDVLLDFADLLMQAGDDRRALTEYLLLARLSPNNAELFEKAATAALKIGDENQARSLAASAVRIDPASPAARILETTSEKND